MSVTLTAIALSPVRLSSFRLRREPPRPAMHREPGYERRYDFDTLFYDVFATADGRAILGIAPPLLNCESQVRAALFRHVPGGEPLRHTLSQTKYGFLLCIDLLGAPRPDAISMQIGEHIVAIPVRPSNCAAFADCRVIYTKSKDNPIEWIQDWARFNVRVHSADAAIIYDNNSGRYNSTELRDALSAVDGLRSSLVVDWSFPHGPGHGPNGEWDSNYCQDCALAHVRFKHCGLASAVLNSDVDELVVPLAGRTVFEELAASGEPCLTYSGRWVTAVNTTNRNTAPHYPGGLVRHKDCMFLEVNTPSYPNKWVADPRRCPEEVAWLAHRIVGLQGAAAPASSETQPTTRLLEFRHFRQISTNWKYPRAWVPEIGSHVRFDRDLASAMAIAFPEYGCAVGS